jgi:hypothetical protein
MTGLTFLTWDSGGNVPPAVGIGQELVARGNEVRFLGYLPQQPAIAARGLAFSALPRSGNFDLSPSGRQSEARGRQPQRLGWAAPGTGELQHNAVVGPGRPHSQHTGGVGRRASSSAPYTRRELSAPGAARQHNGTAVCAARGGHALGLGDGLGDGHALRSRHGNRIARPRSANCVPSVPGSRPTVARRAHPGVTRRSGDGRRIEPCHHQGCRSRSARPAFIS